MSFDMAELRPRAPAKLNTKPNEEIVSDVAMREQFFILANRMRKEEILTDAVLFVDGRKFPTHKCILSVNSDYFLSLFNGPLASTGQYIDLHGMSADTIEMVLDYIYTGVIYISEDNVINILDASCFFLLTSLRNRCVKFLKERIDIDNCLQLFSVGKKFSLTDLISVALEFISAIFKEIVSHHDFQYLSVDELLDIVSLEKLDVSSEDDVLGTVLSWINAESESRKDYLPAILKTIHLPFASDVFLQQLLDTNALLKGNLEAEDLIRLALSLTQSYWTGEMSECDVPKPWCYPRRCIQGIPSILALGGPCLYLFNSEQNQWCQITKCKPRHCAGMAAIGSNVYVFGGSLEWRRKSSGEVFDCERNTCAQIACMSTPRSNFGLLHLDGKLYAMGGYDGSLPLCSAERYDPKLNEWTAISDMNHARDGASETTDSKRVYVIGGYDGSMYLKSVDCYDPDTNTWSEDEIPPMSEFRQNATCAYWNSRIYVIGGYYDDTYHASVEMLNLETNTWSFVTPMPEPRHHAGATALNGRIFVVGGWSGPKPVNIVSVYSVDLDSWSCVSSLPVPVMIRSVAINIPRKVMLSLFAMKEEKPSSKSEQRLSLSTLSVSDSSGSSVESPPSAL